MMTTSLERVINKPGCYKRLKTNPNPNDDKPSFVNKYRVNEIPASCFTKPHSSWHLSEDDELLIDRLEEKCQKERIKQQKSPTSWGFFCFARRHFS